MDSEEDTNKRVNIKTNIYDEFIFKNSLYI